MPKKVTLKSKCEKSARKCAKHFWLVVITITIFLVLSGGSCSRNSVIYIDDSLRITLLDVNEPAPFRGVLITEGRHEELLDYEDEVMSR